MRLSELYFGFFVILWLYSKERSPSIYLVTLIAMMALVLLVDFARFSSDNAILILVSMLIPIAYFGAFTLGAIYTDLNKSKSVPDRLVK